MKIKSTTTAAILNIKLRFQSVWFVTSVDWVLGALNCVAK